MQLYGKVKYMNSKSVIDKYARLHDCFYLYDENSIISSIRSRRGMGRN